MNIEGNTLMQTKQEDSPNDILSFKVSDNIGSIVLSGSWTLDMDPSPFAKSEFSKILSDNPEIKCFSFILDGVNKWDSVLVSFIHRCRNELISNGKTIQIDNLPEGVVKLLGLSKPTLLEKKQNEFALSLELIEETISYFRKASHSVLEFIGEWITAVFSLFLGRSKARFKDFVDSCRVCGASALPIVTLISFLTGLTMAFVGSVQLEKFNAKIYVADLVCLAMVREMGALMVAIIMAGRTGASFAAEIGSMKLNEEIDSLKTFGISPMEFLILPRTLSLIFMIPLLTIYADIIGILGGLTVGTLVMDFSVNHYFEQSQMALQSMWEVYSGLIKSFVFGVIIALVGCFKGINSGSDSSSLGRAVTSSVVTSVTLIVIADAVFEICFSYLDLR